MQRRAAQREPRAKTTHESRLVRNAERHETDENSRAEQGCRYIDLMGKDHRVFTA